MSSLTKMLSVLDIFSSENPSWTIEEMAEHLGYAVPTMYRYVKELTKAGLLRNISAARYGLGTRIIELDYQIRNADPLIIASQQPMRLLADKSGCDVVLGTIYANRIITISHAFGLENLAISYVRGKKMPLFNGALSKCIISTLTRSEVKKIMMEFPEDFVDISPQSVFDEMRDIRKRGYATTHGQLNQGFVGIAVPFQDKAQSAHAALGFIISEQRYSLMEVGKAVQELKKTVDEIEFALSSALQ
ncbi:MAG TPA: IclR family transcriptional regulator C-terminal domain-containing protein [Advenella sp.]|nr:IclR family transcriptional regulator C-terminal domain-containing protein [Advenella sp.]